MSRQFLVINYAVAVSALAVVFSVSANAGLQRTFVSTAGDDANTSASCAPSAPCRTFAAALSVTNAGGEIVVLTSGGYGPATISQPVVITAIGVNASISTITGGANGLTINTTGNVTLIGLNLHGEGVGNDGILVQQVGFLRLYNMLIENFTANGVDFEVSGKLAMYNSAVNDNASNGLAVNNGSANAYVQNISFDHNSIGAGVSSGQLVVADSVATNGTSGFVSTGGTVTLVNDRAAFNGTGLQASGGGTLIFASCVIANNTTAYNVAGGSTMEGTLPGTTLIAPGQGATGTLGTAITLQ
jgi:hypothetical protein